MNAAALWALLLVVLIRSSFGQAWVPEKGEGSFTTGYNYIAFQGHFRSDGSRTPEAASRAQSVLFDVEYGVTSRLAVEFSLPIVAARYASNNPPPFVLRDLFGQTLQAVGSNFYKHAFLDDLHYHATLQDLAFNVRYNLSARPVVITPFVELVAPSHDYAYVGEAAPGRDLWEFQVGANVGKQLDFLLRNSYAEAQLAFVIPEQALNVRTSRTNLSLEFGYSPTKRLSLRGFGHWQHTFEGLHFPADLTTPELALTHERLLKANYSHVGGGASYLLNAKTEVGADVVTFLSGSDTHYGTGMSLRITRSFSLRSVRPRPRSRRP
jgi:hypothetical protein